MTKSDKVYEKFNTPLASDTVWQEDGVGEVNKRLILVEQKKFKVAIKKPDEDKRLLIVVNQLFIHIKQPNGKVSTYKAYMHRKQMRYGSTEWDFARTTNKMDERKYRSPEDNRKEMVGSIASDLKVPYKEAEEMFNEWMAQM